MAFVGPIGFIGLVVPHLMRLWLGPDHRGLIPGSLLAGAILLLLADTLARTVAAPAEIPVGLLTSHGPPAAPPALMNFWSGCRTAWIPTWARAA